MKIYARYARLFGIPLMGAMMLTGFIINDPQTEVNKFMREVQDTSKPSQTVELEVLPVLKAYRPYQYQSLNSDPFALKEYVRKTTDEEQDDSDVGHCQDEKCGDGAPEPHIPYFLEHYDITSLSMVGTVKDPQNNQVALIMTPDSGIVHASIGEYVGKNDGVVVSIEKDHVVVREKFKVPLGWQNRMAILELFQ